MLASDSIVVSERERGAGVKFNRIRRITGYLVYNLETWNPAKLAELHDRTMHTSFTSNK